MIKNYFKIAIRNLWKHKVDSAISIGGLAVGLACCILLVLYVRFELSYDSFHDESDRIYRVIMESTSPQTGDIDRSAMTPLPLVSELQSTYPEIEMAARWSTGEAELAFDGTYIREPVSYADAGFFHLFNFPFLAGNPETALTDPDDVVISTRMADRLFGSRQVIGENITIRFSGYEVREFRVAGIVDPPPVNSSFQFDIVLPVAASLYYYPPGARAAQQVNWYGNNPETWLRLSEGSSVEELTEKLPQLIEAHYPEWLIEESNLIISLQPLDEIYFNEEIRTEHTQQGHSLGSWILTGIAMIILLIAGINFVSLTLSRASGRQGEVGIRMVSGAGRGEIARQFLGEVFLTCSFALFAGVILAELLLPLFQGFVQKSFTLNFLGDPGQWLLLLGMLLFLTLVTGLYPAIVMSGKKGSGIISSRTTAEKIPAFAKGMIVVQFTLSIAFLVNTIGMQQQLDYLFNRDPGFSPSNVVAIELRASPEFVSNMADLYSQEVRRLSGVLNISESWIGFRPDGFTTTSGGTSLEEFGGGLITIQIADENYLETMGIELVDGVQYSSDRQSDIMEGIIVNERFTVLMGLDEPIGKVISEERPNSVFSSPKRIIGVMGDFHFQSFYQNLEPLVLMHIDAMGRSGLTTLFIRINSERRSQITQQLSTLWDELFPGEPFALSYLDERLQGYYEGEERWGRVMQASSAVALSLACFGLFGLAALAARRRTKEIGIRKVMGATLANIIVLLNRDFLKLVSIGFILAIPIAWYAMSQWLADFAYRIEIGPGVFLLAGLAAVLIALATVSWQSMRAAVMNPVNSLRSE